MITAREILTKAAESDKETVHTIIFDDWTHLVSSELNQEYIKAVEEGIKKQPTSPSLGEVYEMLGLPTEPHHYLTHPWDERIR